MLVVHFGRVARPESCRKYRMPGLALAAPLGNRLDYVARDYGAEKFFFEIVGSRSSLCSTPARVLPVLEKQLTFDGVVELEECPQWISAKQTLNIDRAFLDRSAQGSRHDFGEQAAAAAGMCDRKQLRIKMLVVGSHVDEVFDVL